MSKSNDFEHIPCPHCKKKGLRWDFAANQPRCPHCHLSGFPAGEQAAPPPPQTPAEKKTPSAPTSNSEIERAAKANALREIVKTTYYRQVLNGTHEQVTIERAVPVLPEDKIPDLTIRYNEAMFHRWRLRELIKQEKRWARDDLRKRGFVKVGRWLDATTQKAIPLKAIPGKEDERGGGRYALGQAIAVVRRAEQKLKEGGDKKPPRDD